MQVWDRRTRWPRTCTPKHMITGWGTHAHRRTDTCSPSQMYIHMHTYHTRGITFKSTRQLVTHTHTHTHTYSLSLSCAHPSNKASVSHFPALPPPRPPATPCGAGGRQAHQSLWQHTHSHRLLSFARFPSTHLLLMTSDMLKSAAT